MHKAETYVTKTRRQGRKNDERRKRAKPENTEDAERPDCREGTFRGSRRPNRRGMGAVPAVAAHDGYEDIPPGGCRVVARLGDKRVRAHGKRRLKGGGNHNWMPQVSR